MSSESLYLFVVFCLVSLGLYGCLNFGDNEDPIAMRSLYWVEGEWKGRVNGGMMFETWVVQEDSSLRGYSYILANSDTIFREHMNIERRDSGIFYVVNMRHNDGPVAFKFSECTPKGCVFENLEHDFPTRIVYSNTIGDMLLARIEGVRDNKPDTSRYFMHRNKIFIEQW